MEKINVFLVVLASVVVVSSLPLNEEWNREQWNLDNNRMQYPIPVEHSIQKRFINPMFNLESRGFGDIAKIRTKRSSEDDCEKLHLCKMHARAGHSLFAAYELYFVNKENARLWDHHSRSIEDCEERYGDCYDK